MNYIQCRSYKAEQEAPQHHKPDAVTCGIGLIEQERKEGIQNGTHQQAQKIKSKYWRIVEPLWVTEHQQEIEKIGAGKGYNQDNQASEIMYKAHCPSADGQRINAVQILPLFEQRKLQYRQNVGTNT